MDAVGVAGIVQALANAGHVTELAVRLLQGVRLYSEVATALCYLRDALGEQLHAVASEGVALEVLPPISGARLDSPLWYCMHTKEVCLVEQPCGLLGLGADFDALRTVLGARAALLAWPILDDQGQSRGVLLLSGEASTLHAWRNDRTWAAVMAVYQCLFGTLSEHQMGCGRRTPDEPMQAQRLEARTLIKREFVGDSAIARQLRDELLLLAESRLAVLITGETGAGKDHAAWLIHQASCRSGHAFVPLNCAAIPKDLIEAELFGCTRGAYTGATEAREGLVAAADGGTLFLDEIGDMPLPLQGTLLRLLNEKKYRPVGAVEERNSDFRLLCATHQPLSQRVREGRFRQDLYFRICQLSLHLPTLRSRREDLGPLVAALVREHNGQERRFVAGATAASLQLLYAHSFPGNIRELRNLVMAACERTPCGQPIEHEVLRQLMHHSLASAPEKRVPSSAGGEALQSLLATDDLPQALEAFERLMIDARLQQLGGSRRRAAESLGVPKRTLARKCQKWSLEAASHE
ncbi:sigma 54-interacting transcriptional regulator [Pseudomonas aegrilactucae]|uniref:Sigma-54 dependent transcriptional regulator n=1 Tax=Pseudomonas aegrilactucae TaxID=2854028 RepID=A0A9Q2XI75_9PSED|nr:sigma-54 dependent transcriptional regulator [Pseudomonas aegrilactucae]MBV6286780.1 sigma-54 dependent transcriptional regulator [Pseudomonas aegrilactucae]